jgi:hypothetical protein
LRTDLRGTEAPRERRSRTSLPQPLARRHLARPAAQRGLALDIPGRRRHDLSTDEEARKILFGERAR